MIRPLAVVTDFSNAPSGYLATAGRMHVLTWSGRFFDGPVDPFFPGFGILALAALGIATTLRHRSPPAGLLRWRVGMLVVIGFAGVVLSLGTRTPIYGWLFAVFPPMQAMRAASRFGNLFLLAVAVLGGIGAATIDRRWIAIALLVFVNAESLRAPIAYEPFTGIPGVYQQV